MKNSTIVTPRAAGKVRPYKTSGFMEFANDRGFRGRDGGSNYKKGEIYFANDSRFSEANYSEPLTNYLVGWRDPNNIEASVQMIAPNVPVNGRKFEWKAAVNSEEFLSETVDDERAIGSDFKRVVFTGTDVQDKTHNRGLTLIVDLDDVAVGGEFVPAWQQQKVAKLTRRLWRNEFRRAAAALSAAAVGVPYVWDKTNGVNPDMDVQIELRNATNLSGIRPNRALYGDSAFLYRNQSYGAQNSPAGYLGYGTDPMASLAAALQVDKVMVSRERYQSAAAAKSEVIASNVYLYFAEDGVDTEDPSNIKRFITQFSAEQGGGYFRVYVEQIGAKLVAITVEFYSKIIVTYSGGIRQMQITGPN